MCAAPAHSAPTPPDPPPTEALLVGGASWRTAAVMQPYFFPYGGYFALIRSVDVFVLDDLAQYTPKRWMNRNRIIRPGQRCGKEEWQYLTLPVQHCPVSTPIGKVPLAVQPWCRAMQGRLTAYARAPFYNETMRIFAAWADGVEQLSAPTLADVNTLGLQLVCNALGLTTPLVRLSALAPHFAGYRPPYPKGQNALAVCRALGGVTEYRNLPGGAVFYPRQPYRDAGIRLRFQQWTGQQHEPPLSVLHLLMTLPYEQIDRLLCQIRLSE